MSSNTESTSAICPVGTDVERAAQLLANGGVVAFGTETVYGLGADALNPHAVSRVFAVKERPKFDPLIVHLADYEQLSTVADVENSLVEQLAAVFWPGPLTLVLPKKPNVPDLVTSGLPTVAVRIPEHPQARALIAAAGKPIAAPSANPFGRISPTRADHVAEQLGTKIDYIFDGGPCRVGVESTVLDVSTNPPTLLRPGGVTVEALEDVIGPVALPSSAAETHPSAPGMLPSHYAPGTPLQIRESVTPPDPSRKLGLLAFREPSSRDGWSNVEVLSSTGDLVEAAANFFAALRRLDALELDGIVADSFPSEGLGRALNDRLQRAAHTE
ncbi:L-threonylcarbamoyladenylate synthase [Thalassoroseus pseudoceratinae]|uniref:L-threonylcarbamoyladenylate synthase n=1 Tax=Thalassoroseus pseudoceratinae TaxID=2713176 RepID=UPI0014210910|nr:L-threonylcarbamoyladenylate synthase [Thalassoroseus pseudoceratinae]